MKLLPLLLTTAALAAPAAAEASSAGLTYEYRDYHGLDIDYGSTLTFRGGSGEANDVQLTVADGVYTFVDKTATVSGGEGCERVDAHTLECKAKAIPEQQSVYQGIERLVVDLGDGDDKLAAGEGLTVIGSFYGGAGGDAITTTGRSSSGYPVVYGEAGDDTLTGDDGDNLLIGGPGQDTVAGAGGDDILGDDDGPGAGAADTYDGGPGRDLVNYLTTTESVTIDLADGTGDEGDGLTSIENAMGGKSDDRISGDGGRNDFYGGRGDDLIEGRGGPDRLAGEAGVDRIRGGSGSDLINSNEGQNASPSAAAVAEPVSCGSGDDLVRYRNVGDRLARDCDRAVIRSEESGAGQQLLVGGLELSGRTLRGLAFRCGPLATDGGCAAKVIVRDRRGKGAVTLGSARVSADAEGTVRVPIRVSPTALGRLRRSGLQPLSIEVRLRVHRDDPDLGTFVDTGTDTITTAALRRR